MSKVTQPEPVTRDRKIYAETLVELMKVLFGVDIDPSRVDLLRTDNKTNGRVLFHPVIDDEPMLKEAYTIEHIQTAIEAMKFYRRLVIQKGTTRGLTASPPSVFEHDSHITSVRDSAAMQELVHSNVVSLRKSDHVGKTESLGAETSHTGKNPKRVAAGRQNANKQWERNRARRKIT